MAKIEKKNSQFKKFKKTNSKFIKNKRSVTG